jgi:hypothetical protein
MRTSQYQMSPGGTRLKVVYRNLGNGRFEDVTARLGAPLTTPKAGRGAAFGDYDNDGEHWENLDVDRFHTLREGSATATRQ